MIHSEHPFRQPPDDRDPARRFRGRLASGVTIVTAGIESNRTGLTVSSLLVVEGDPALAHLVVGPTTDLWELAPETGLIDRVEVTDLLDPMVHYRSGYRRLSPSDGPLKCSVANPRS
jgi:hypothetical protein